MPGHMDAARRELWEMVSEIQEGSAAPEENIPASEESASAAGKSFTIPEGADSMTKLALLLFAGQTILTLIGIGIAVVVGIVIWKMLK